MKLTLAELLPLKKTVSIMIKDKLDERYDASFVEFEKNEKELEQPQKTFNELTEELRKLRDDYRVISVLLETGNLNSKFEWEGKSISISEGIELAKQLRGEFLALATFGRNKKITRIASYGGESTYRKALYEPQKVAQKAEKLKKKANRLSMLIEKTNHKIEVEVPCAEKYL